MKIAETDHEVTEILFYFVFYFIKLNVYLKIFLNFYFFIKIVSINIQMFLKSSFYL